MATPREAFPVPPGRPDGEPATTVCLTVGTAGHIDHGKTQLVACLTGCNTDCLPEEKARGMTIDLGFATCQLPNRRRVGIVDVPGHERFIHNMVAGATAIDAVLLVVAADDGVMPQTIEHFHIVRLLGVRSGMVAVTKTDLAPPERVAEVVERVRELTRGSFLDGCPIVPLSTKTGAGFDAFYDTFVSLVDRTAERNAGGCFRMHVERSFVLKGLGPIVSGIPRSGRVRIGDVLELLPAGDAKKVRGLQVYGEDAMEGRAGECVALRLGDLDAGEARRGMVLASPGYFEPARFVNVRFQLLPGLDRPLRPRTAVRLHIGTSDMPGHLLLPDLAPLKPGSETYVQVQLQNAVVAAPHDVCVVRMLSPARTLGGGTVIGTEPEKMRRTRGTWVEHCAEQERAFRDPASAVAYVVARARTALDAATVAKRCLLSPETAAAGLKSLAAKGDAVALEGNRFAHGNAIREVRMRIEAALGALHDRSPLSLGFPRKELMPRLQDDRPLVEHALADLLREGRVRQNSAGYQLASRTPALDPEQEKVAVALRQIYRSKGFQSPRPDELTGLTGAPEPRVQAVLAHLCQTGELVRMDDRVVLHRDFVELSKQKILEHLARRDSLEPGQIKDALGTTRKYVIPILEYWDAQRLTRRVGNARVLKK